MTLVHLVLQVPLGPLVNKAYLVLKEALVPEETLVLLVRLVLLVYLVSQEYQALLVKLDRVV